MIFLCNLFVYDNNDNYDNVDNMTEPQTDTNCIVSDEDILNNGYMKYVSLIDDVY